MNREVSSRHFKMNYLILLLTLISLHACSQNKHNEANRQELPKFIQYVVNPNPNDTLCIEEIEKAKKDIEHGKIVFTKNMGFLYGNFRYKNELEELCKLNGLEFDFDLFSCVQIEGQTQGCYGTYMDKVIYEKFGFNFKKQLHKKADSLFLSRANSENKIVQYWDCDERARLPSEIKRTSDFIPSISILIPEIKKKEGDFGGWPFFDLGFVVEKDSTISSFYISNFVAKLEENEKFKDELYLIAVQNIKKYYPTWVPGKISGVPVRTDNNVRIFFTREE